jgi:3-oxoacyl-[acyl-carrier-protein] synthase III
VSARIRAIATHLPERVVSNAELAAETPNWKMAAVADRAGVTSRHIAAPGETAFDLAAIACDKLFADLPTQDAGIDAIIFCTQSPDFLMPGNAHLLHDQLHLPDEVLAFDINLACSGFIYGLAIADGLIAAGTASRVLLATADTYSRWIHPKDRSARVLFGDGAAVTIIERCSGAAGFASFDLGSHGKQYSKFYVPAGGMRRPRSAVTLEEVTDRSGSVRTQEHIQMDGMGVWSFINSAVPKQIRLHLEKNGLTLADVDHFIFHQASAMTLNSLAKILGIDPGREHRNLAAIGNTVSASIALCLADVLRAGRLKQGDRMLLSGFGVGLSYGTTSFVCQEAIDVY